MSYEFSGYARKTFRYDQGWKELDRYEFVGWFRVLKSRHTESRDQDTGKQFLLVRAPSGVQDELVIDALSNEFSFSCRCEHDCCGHWSSYVRDVRHVKRREWRVTIHHHQNV